MLKEILEIIVCPVCLPGEVALIPETDQADADEIFAGRLRCPACARVFPIRDGLADLRPAIDPAAARDRYESPALLSSYLWSHFADWLNDPMASSAYQEWAALILPSSGTALDIGTAVGRFALELRKNCDLVVGIDTSASFIKAARALLRDGSHPLFLPDEGRLGRHLELFLPPDQPRDRIEFLLADAQALPFKSGSFT
ncbi:MAG: methyltransferase domain-containing protein, partial [Deltaproteobacteria bacterium]|nr:methyltransferase domain-containing protein [Deltaproteobacteria bacterium]